jgi:hypothetical protein
MDAVLREHFAHMNILLKPRNSRENFTLDVRQFVLGSLAVNTFTGTDLNV